MNTKMSGEAKLLQAIFGGRFPEDFELSEEGTIAVHQVLKQFHADRFIRYSGNANGFWRMQRILRQHYGIGTAPQTLEAIAAQLYNVESGQRGITRERVRSIESQALRVLRHRRYSDSLKPYLPKFED